MSDPKLEPFIQYVKEQLSDKDDFWFELYERLTNEDDYSIFCNLRQAANWISEKRSEAADAQWNNCLTKIYKAESKLRELFADSHENDDIEVAVDKLLSDLSHYPTVGRLESYQILMRIRELDSERNF